MGYILNCNVTNFTIVLTGVLNILFVCCKKEREVGTYDVLICIHSY